MQFATSQRPQPPPVPPRPSRQVVAEALKRTVRPPCPTRQAPPPPNTRPWRIEACEKKIVPGRTVVYESGKENQKNCDVRLLSNESQRAISSTRYDITGNTAAPAAAAEKTEERGLTPAPSERNVAHRERQQQQQSQLRRDRINSSAIHPRESVPEIRTEVNKPYDDNGPSNRSLTILPETPKTTKDEFIKSQDLDKDAPKDLERKIIISENSTNDITEFTEFNEDSGNSTKSLSLIDNRVTRNIEKNSNVRDKVVETLSPDESIKPDADDVAVTSINDVTQSHGSNNTISSDDCATVVVVDETERKTLNEDNDNIQHQDWLEAGIRYSSTKITIPAGDDSLDCDEFNPINERDDNRNCFEGYQDSRTYVKLDHFSIHERIAMSSLQGLPPLPRSLSGFNLSDGRREAIEPPPPPTRSSSKNQKNVKTTNPSSSRPSPPGRQLTTLDTQLAILRKEMFGLRQLDLSLLSQLWSLNESIQEFRQLLQEQEDRAPSPSPSSEEGDDNSYGNHHPPPPPRRPAPILHHHRPPRPPRPLRPPASDESPSSEEYGAV